jgi:hypothetical protein
VENPARFQWNEVIKIAHYWLEVNAMTRPMQIREQKAPYETKDQGKSKKGTADTQ